MSVASVLLGGGLSFRPSSVFVAPDVGGLLFSRLPYCPFCYTDGCWLVVNGQCSRFVLFGKPCIYSMIFLHTNTQPVCTAYCIFARGLSNLRIAFCCFVATAGWCQIPDLRAWLDQSWFPLPGVEPMLGYCLQAVRCPGWRNGPQALNVSKLA